MSTFNPLILDKNPWTNVPFQNIYINDQDSPNTYRGYNESLIHLPIYKKRDEFIDVLSKHRVIFIESGTGSGKTVLVPRFIEHLHDYHAKMIITIPKKESVRSAAEYQAKLNDVELGKEIGYQFRGQKRHDSKITKMLYCTDGTLVQMLLHEPLLHGINVVIIDEAHERSIQIDLLLFLLKRIFQSREDFQLVIMSAKANTKVFADYFMDPVFKFKLLNAGEETTFPIQEIYLDKAIDDSVLFLPKAIDIVEDILKETNTGDILVFVTSHGEASKAKRLLADRIDYLNTNTVLKKNKTQKLTVQTENEETPLVIYMGVGFADMGRLNKNLLLQKNTFREKTNNRGRNYNRRISFVTNFAESSLTMKGYSFVIDSGWEFSKVYFPENLVSRLMLRRISNAQRIQRRGRVGRMGPGVVYYLYTKTEAKAFNDFPTPSILSSDLTEYIVKFFQLPDVTDLGILGKLLMQLIEPPPVTNVISALLIYDLLKWLEDYRPANNNVHNSSLSITSLSELKGKLSDHGKMMINTVGSQLPSPSAAEALIFGSKAHVGHDIAAVLGMAEACKGRMDNLLHASSKKVLGNPSKDEKERIAMREKFYSPMGDFITLLNIWDEFDKKRENRDAQFDWVRKHGWNIEVFNEAKRTIDKFKRVLQRLHQGTNSKNLVQFEVEDGVSDKEALELAKNWAASKKVKPQLPENQAINIIQNAGTSKFGKKEREQHVLESLIFGYWIYGAYRKSGIKTWTGCFAPSPPELELSKYSSIALLSKRLPNWVFGVSWGGFNDDTVVELATKFPASEEPKGCGNKKK